MSKINHWFICKWLIQWLSWPPLHVGSVVSPQVASQNRRSRGPFWPMGRGSCEITISWWLYKRFNDVKKTKHPFFSMTIMMGSPYVFFTIFCYSETQHCQEFVEQRAAPFEREELEATGEPRRSTKGQLLVVWSLDLWMLLGSLTCKKIGTFMIGDDIDAWDMIDA